MVFTHTYCEQIYLATGWLQRKIAQKCLEMLLFLYRLHIFASDQIKEEKNKKSFCFFFFQQLLSNFRRKKQLWTFFGATFQQLFEKFRATFGKSRATCGKPYHRRLHSIFNICKVALILRR